MPPLGKTGTMQAVQFRNCDTYLWMPFSTAVTLIAQLKLPSCPGVP